MLSYKLLHDGFNDLPCIIILYYYFAVVIGSVSSFNFKFLLNELIQVVTEYRKRGKEFLLQAINHPSYLEDLTGLTEFIYNETDDNDDDDDFVKL